MRFYKFGMVRTAACITSYLLMLVSYYYMMHQMGYDNLYAFSTLFLLLPISDGYFEYVLLALLYASFISISFFAAGLVFHYVRALAVMKIEEVRYVGSYGKWHYQPVSGFGGCLLYGKREKDR